MMLHVLLCSLLLFQETLSDTTVTIYNEWLSQGGRVNYEIDRWNKHNGLDNNNLISKCKSIRTEAGRWMNRDLNGNLFANWPQSSSHHGYPDPHYLQDQTRARSTWGKYMDVIHGYGHDINMVWVVKGLAWPNWIDKSHHKGQFPNNLDAAAEFVSLMVQGAKDYSGGHIPPFFEVMNEPDAHWQVLDSKTIVDYHRTIAQKLKSRFGIKVGGPTYTGYISNVDMNNFNLWKGASAFMDMSLDHMDFFSFHAYNDLHVNGGSHYFTGINEARLVGLIDMLENKAHIKKGKKFPLIVSEYGRGAVHGTSQDAHSGIVDFATLYLSNAQMFTYLGLREFMERAIVFYLSNEQYPGHNSLNWSLFTRDGHATKLTMFYAFWNYLGNSHKFLKHYSAFTNSERTVKPLVLANPNTKDLVVLLHNHGNGWQNVHLDFHGGWMKPTTGESTCIVYQNGNPVMHSNVHFDTTKNHDRVGLPGEASCLYKFKTNYNFGSLRTNTENTYYGSNMVIPISNGHAQTTIHLPGSGYHTAHLRVGISSGNKSQNVKPTSITVNGNKLTSTYMLYDANKNSAKTKWEVWEYLVPENHLSSTNTISMSFSGSGGHVSSVALIVGKLQ